MAVRKSAQSPPTADQVRRRLITWFYDLNKKGGAPRGMRDLCKEHKDVKTTMIYTHVLTRGGLGVRSAVDDPKGAD